MAGPGSLVDVVVAELDRVVDRLSFEQDQGGRLTSAKRQLAYVDRRLSTADVASRLGLKPRTVRNWQLGRTKPSKRSRAALDELYQDVRKPEVVRRNRGKVSLGDTSIQISGTISFSDDEEYRDNFGGKRGKQPVITRQDWAPILVLWRDFKRRRSAAVRELLHERMNEALQHATDPIAHFDAEDYEFTILG